MMVKKKHFFPVKTTFLLTILAFLFSIFFASTPSTFAVTEEENNCRNSHGNWVNDQCDCGSGRILGSDGSCTTNGAFSVSGSTESTLLIKSLVLGLKKCWNSQYMSSEIGGNTTQLNQPELFGSGSIFGHNEGWDFIQVPTHIGNSDKSKGISCAQALNGVNNEGTVEGILKLFGKESSSSFNTTLGPNTKIINLGYTKKEDTGSATSYKFAVDYTIAGTAVNGGVSTNGSFNVIANYDSLGLVNSWRYNGQDVPSCDPFNPGQGIGIDQNGKLAICYNTTEQDLKLYYYDGDGIVAQVTNIVDCATALANGESSPAACDSAAWSSGSASAQIIVGKVNVSSAAGEGEDATGIDPSARYVITNYDTAFNTFLKYLNGDATLSSFYLTKKEEVQLYTLYLQNAINEHVLTVSASCVDSKNQFENGKQYVPYNGKWCEVNDYTNAANNYSGDKVFADGQFAVYDSNSFNMTTASDKAGALSEIINRLMALADSVDPGDTSVDPTGQTPVSEGEDLENSSVCLKENAAGAVSWAICPTMEGLAEGSDGIYNLIKGYLRIDSKLLESNGSNNGTYQVWQYFVGFANVIAIIFLLFIIFSQVTGYGINNYGVKKALPKLIIMVLLINLSFVICQLAVDLSNVIGQSLSLLLNSVATTVASNVSGHAVSVGGVNWQSAFAVGTAGMASLVPTIIMAVLTFGVGWIAIIIVVFAVLAMFVAVLAVFVMLAAREILVVALVALSPLAFACNIFPGTEKIFKRWFDIFKGMLMIFPIASGLYGVGCIIQAIVISSKGGTLEVWESIIAALAPMAPFVALPGLLRSSLNAVGSLGAQISGLGNRARGGLNNASRSVQNSERGREAQRQRQMNRNEHIVNRLNQREASGHNLSAYQNRRRARASAAFNAAAREDIMAQTANPELLVAGTAAYQAMEAGVENQEREKRIGDRVALLQNRNPDDNGLFADYQAAIAAGDDDQAVAIARYAGRSKPTANAFSDFIKANTGTMNRAVAREIMTGANAGTYKASNATLYEYASQIHIDDRQHGAFVNPTATRGTAAGDAVVDYADWATTDVVDARTGDHLSNIELAVEHNMSKPEELAGQGRSTLREVEAAKNRTTHTYQSGTATRAANFSTITTFRPDQEQALERNAAGALTLDNVDNTKEQNYRNLANGRGTIAQENAATAADIAAARSSDTLAGTYRDSAGNIRHVVRNADGTYNLFDGNNVQVHIRRGPTTANDVDSNLRGGGYTKV